MIKLKNILNEQGKFDALKNKIFKSKDFKEEPIIKEPTRAEKDEAWKQEKCNDPKAVIGVGTSMDQVNARKKSQKDGNEKLKKLDNDPRPGIMTARGEWKIQDSGTYYCLTCMTRHSNI